MTSNVRDLFNRGHQLAMKLLLIVTDWGLASLGDPFSQVPSASIDVS